MKTLFALALLILSLTGCTTYYEVTDSNSGKVYLTNNWHLGQNMYTGSAALKDLPTGKTVVLQSYEMEKVDAHYAERVIGR